MTMLELLVVAGILSVLVGFGVGFLRRGDGVPVLRSVLNAELRLAALDARTRALPTEVLVTPGKDGGLAAVVARGLDPVVLVTFEAGQRFADSRIEPQLGGVDVAGRCGRARTVDPTVPTPALQLPLGPTVVDLGSGLALRVDVLLHRRQGGQLLRLGRAIDVQLDDSGAPRVRVQATGQEGRGGAAVNLQPSASLPIGRWCTFEIGADGHSVWCTVDGRELQKEPLHERVLQQKDDQLIVLPADQPLAATVDELQLFAYAFSAPQRLPDGIVPAATYRIAFDTMGEPVAPPDLRFQIEAEQRQEVLHIGPGGILQ